MRIDQLRLTAFGRFRNQQIDLGPGLTILYGPNESGKSTIQKFVLGMLYGLKKRSLRREYSEDAARYRPWLGEEYRGALLYSLDDGAAYRVERNFDPARESVRLYEAATGADLTGQFAMDRRKELLFGEAHLRMPAEVFTSTAWIGQMEVGRLEMGRELVQRVANLSESGREDLSVRSALRWIEEQVREIGTDRAPTKPYARVARQIGERRAELERAHKMREQTLDWEAGLQEARTAMAALEQELAEAHRALAWAQLAEAEERYQRVEGSTAQMQAARQQASDLGRYAFFPVDLKVSLKEQEAQVIQATAARERYQQRLADLQVAQAALEARLGPLAGLALGADAAAEVAAAARMTDASLARLPGLQEEAARLDEMITRLGEAIAPLTPAAEAGEEALAEISRVEQEIGAIRARMSPATIDRLRGDAARLERERQEVGGTSWLVLAVLLVAAAGGLYLLPDLLPAEYWLPAVLGAAGLGLVSVLPYVVARRVAAQIAKDLSEVRLMLKAAQTAHAEDAERISRLEKKREMILRKLGVVSVGELQNQIIRYEQLTARRDGQLLRRETIQAEIRRAEAELGAQQGRLQAVLGAAFGADVAAARLDEATLEQLQASLGQYQVIRFELDGLAREAEELAHRIAEEEGRIAIAQAEWEALLAEAEVEDLAAFEEGCRLHELWRKAEREAEGLRTALSALLGGEEGGEIAKEVERLQAQVTGERPAELVASREQQRVIRILEAERADWHARASDLAARIETASAEIAETAELEREIAALQEERLGMERELEALELARSVIQEVSSQIHREFAPRLNRGMGEIIAALTQGRYRSVRIDEELRIRAIAEGDRTVDLTSLSGGTVDQFYLALRVAILDLLTEGQERIPLFLDDPFVQYDNQRLEAALWFLSRVADQRQVVLMTCHRRELEMAKALGAQIVELEA